jgi:hypothetical protein
MNKKQVEYVKAQAALFQAAKSYDAANALYKKAVERLRRSEKGLTREQLQEAIQAS